MPRSKPKPMSTPDTRKATWEELAQFLARVDGMTDRTLGTYHEKVVGFPIIKWTTREDVLVRIVYHWSKKVIDG